jgi:hypothetical protein
MQYNKEEVIKHLHLITKYSDFIISLNNKYIRVKRSLRNRLILNDLIYFTDDKLLNKLKQALNYINHKFKNAGNIFLLDYSLLKKQSNFPKNEFFRNCVNYTKSIINIKDIYETILRVVNNEPQLMDEIYLKTIM